MGTEELTEPEIAIRQAAETGDFVDLRVGDPAIDDSVNGPHWGEGRTIRADRLCQLLTGDKIPTGVRVRGARIVGELSLEAASVPCPVALIDCYFERAINLDEATVVSLRLAGSSIPGLSARQLATRGDLRLDDGFVCTGMADLHGAHIGGNLVCTGGKFTNRGAKTLVGDGLTVQGDIICAGNFVSEGEMRLLGSQINGQVLFASSRMIAAGGAALAADGLHVNLDVLFLDGFIADGEVRLLGARIGGELKCRDSCFLNADGFALLADFIRVGRATILGGGFTAEGEVTLGGAQLDGGLHCDQGRLSNAGTYAFSVNGATVGIALTCTAGFIVEGQVTLIGTHVKGLVNFNAGRFSNPGGCALAADRLNVDQSMSCADGFTAEGDVRLSGAQIGSQLVWEDAKLINGHAIAMSLEGTVVARDLLMTPAVLEGSVNLTAARVGTYIDNANTSVGVAWLNDFAYGAIEPALPVGRRLRWLKTNCSGYSPQAYDQLAATYRRSGHDAEARKVLIAKQQSRRAQLGLAGKVWNLTLGLTVGYGYRTWRAALWLAALVFVGSFIFSSAYPGQLTPARQPSEQPAFQSTIYALDLVLPVINLHQRDAWIPHGAFQWWVLGFTLAGWILTTAVALSLTGVLKRE